MISARREIKAR